MVVEYNSNLQAILEFSEDAFIRISIDGTIQSWNKGSEQMFGYTSKEMIGKNISLIIPPECINNDKNNFSKISNNKIVERYETTRIKKNGEQLFVSLIVSELKDSAGNITGFYQVARDITSQKKSEAELIKANKELAFQNEEKHKRAEKLLIANKELAFQNSEKEKRANELMIANEELAFQNEEKHKRAEELLIANKELAFQNSEKEKRANELIIANKELAFQNEEKYKRAEELITANVELAFQNGEKEKRSNEVIIPIKALVASENRYRRLFEAARDGILILNADTGVIEDVNPFMIEILGYSHREFLGKELWEIGVFSDINANKEAFLKLKEEGYIRYKDLPLKTKNGLAISVEFVSNRYDVSGGQVFQCHIRNITERKIAEENNKRLTERLLLATQSAQLGIWDWDIKNNVLMWDEGMYRLYNIAENEFNSVLEGFFSRVHQEDRQRIQNEMKLGLANKKDYKPEFRIVWGDSSVRYINASAIIERDNDGNAIRMIGANWDVTAQKEKEQHLKLLESVITNTTDSVLITEAEPFDQPGPRILYVNDAFTKMTGYSSEEVIGKTPRILQGPKSDKAELKRLSEAMRRWETCETTTINYKKSGEEFWINFILTPVANEKGWYTHWISIERDVTEKKLVEIQLKELNNNLQHRAKELALSNAELEQFAYVASHDLQEPLRMITNFLTQLKKKYGDVIDDKGKKYIGFAVDGATRMRQIILDLLEYSRVGRTEDEKEELDLNELIDEIKILLGKTIEEKEAVFIIDELPKIHANRSPMRQIFQNLISNSLKYSNNEIPVQIHITVKELEHHWQFAVSDNGIGIEKEYFDKIFIIFQRLHNKDEYSGTGIGLAIVKKIIDVEGGKIWVESEEARPDDPVGRGKGSTFYFTIKKI